MPSHVCGFVMRNGIKCVKNTYKRSCRNHIHLTQRLTCIHCDKPTSNPVRRCGRMSCRSNILQPNNKILPLLVDDDIETMTRKDVEKIIKDAEPTKAQIKAMEANEAKIAKAAKAVKPAKPAKEAKAAKEAKPTKEAKPICGGKTKLNAPCKRIATTGSKFCSSHNQ